MRKPRDVVIVFSVFILFYLFLINRSCKRRSCYETNSPIDSIIIIYNVQSLIDQFMIIIDTFKIKIDFF